MSEKNGEVNSLEEKGLINKENMIDLYQRGFEYTKEKHNLCLASISDIRNISNYIVTGVITFTGFVLSGEEFLTTNFRKVIFFGFLFLIIVTWLYINWSIKISLGIKIVKTIDLVKLFNSEEFNEIKIREKLKSSSPKVAIYEYLLKRKCEEYEKAEDLVSKKMEPIKKSLITLSGIFFLLSILFIINSRINLILIF